VIIFKRPGHPVLQPLLEVDGMPLYRQVKRTLITLIESGQYRAGDSLPSEADLSSQLVVSVGTLRRAVDELVLEQVLVRRQGKGTFVVMHNSERYLFQFFHVEKRGLDAMQEREYPQVECLSFDRFNATDAEAAALGVHESDPVFRIDNRLKLSGKAVVFDRLSISVATFKGLTEKRFIERQSTVYHLYQRDFGITVLRAQERARAVSASKEACRVLGLAAGQSVLELHRIALTFGEKPVEYRVSTINTQQHDYVSVRSKGQKS
jgi:GntR family transcriptional regulator